MLETCAIRVRQDLPTASIGAAFEALLSETGDVHRRVDGYVLVHDDGREWLELNECPGGSTQFVTWLARTLAVPLLAVIASIDEVAYDREGEDDAAEEGDPLPDGIAKVDYLHVEASGETENRSAQYDPEEGEYYPAGDAWETLQSIMQFHLPESGTKRARRLSGFLPSTGLPARLELLCALISSAGAFGIRSVGGSTMVSVEAGGARRFERIEEGDLELINGATGLVPS